MNTFMGMRVEIASMVPKMQLSEDCPVTPEFRKEIDAWMRSFFGEVCVVPEGQVLMIGKNIVLMRPDTYAAIQKGRLP